MYVYLLTCLDVIKVDLKHDKAWDKFPHGDADNVEYVHV